MSWEIVYAKQAMKDAIKLAASGLKPKAQELLTILASDPFQNPPPFEKLVGDLAGTYGTSEQPLSPRPAYDQAGEKRRDRVKWRNSH